MHGQLLSKEQFDSYIEKNVRPALNVVGTNLQNPNKLNQVAARMLGFGTYEEKLQPFHKRESNIRESIHFELCPFQGDRPTFKALNAIVVLDEAEQAIYARILRGGEEAQRVTEDGDTYAIRYGHKDEPTPSFSNITVAQDNGKVSFDFPVTLPNGDIEKNHFSMVRTHEGIIIDVYYDIDASCEVYDSIGLMFSDIEDDDYRFPDQASVAVHAALPSCDGAYYQWLKPVSFDGETRFITIDTDGGSKPNLSAMLFTSPQEAREAVLDGRFDFHPEDVDGCVIVRVDKRIHEVFTA